MWVAQFITMMSFSFVFPFIPLFVQELGIQDPAQAVLWAGISGGAMGLTMFLSGPIWGMMGDRYGRKRNVLRAMSGGAILMALTGLSANVYQLTALRFLMGMVSGSLAPSLALVVSASPKERVTFVIGALQSSFFLGNTIGPLVGGFLAGAVGFRGAFFATAALVTVAGALVLLLVREDFQRPAESGPIFRHEAFEGLLGLVTSRAVAPILATIFVVTLSPMLMFGVLPVLLEVLTPGRGALSTGFAFSILGLAAALASYVTGWLSGRVQLARVLVVSCIGLSLSYLPFLVVDSVSFVYLFLGIGGVFQGALMSSTGGLLGRAAPSEKQGAAFGAMQSVSAGAFGIGPLVGGAIAVATGLRSVFLVQSVVLLGAAVVVVFLLSGRETRTQPAERVG